MAQFSRTTSQIDAVLDEVVAARGDSASLSAEIATKQDVLTFDSVPTENSANPVTSGGVYSAVLGVETPTTLPDKTDTSTQQLYADIHDASPGWWKRATNLIRVRNMPPDYSGGFLLHVINTTLGNPQRKKIFLYPVSAGTEGSFYILTELAPVDGIPVWSPWYKFEGTVVS